MSAVNAVAWGALVGNKEGRGAECGSTPGAETDAKHLHVTVVKPGASASPLVPRSLLWVLSLKGALPFRNKYSIQCLTLGVNSPCD